MPNGRYLPPRGWWMQKGKTAENIWPVLLGFGPLSLMRRGFIDSDVGGFTEPGWMDILRRDVILTPIVWGGRESVDSCAGPFRRPTDGPWAKVAAPRNFF